MRKVMKVIIGVLLWFAACYGWGFYVLRPLLYEPPSKYASIYGWLILIFVISFPVVFFGGPLLIGIWASGGNKDKTGSQESKSKE